MMMMIMIIFIIKIGTDKASAVYSADHSYLYQVSTWYSRDHFHNYSVSFMLCSSVLLSIFFRSFVPFWRGYGGAFLSLSLRVCASLVRADFRILFFLHSLLFSPYSLFIFSFLHACLSVYMGCGVVVYVVWCVSVCVSISVCECAFVCASLCGFVCVWCLHMCVW